MKSKINILLIVSVLLFGIVFYVKRFNSSKNTTATSININTDKQIESEVNNLATKFGKGNDAKVISDIIARNEKSKDYVFVFEINKEKKGGTRRGTPGHQGEYLDPVNFPHGQQVIDFAEKHTMGWMSYDATKTPSNCNEKRTYVHLVHGDDNKDYVIGRGYCTSRSW